jgi:HPt (histidine-containing phosphotransfer) domain-containing protein
MDDADFREIVEEFVVFLKDQLAAIHAACAADDLPSVAHLAHTLKGTAGTAGFAAFTEPAKQLQHLAEKERRAEIPLVLLVLDNLASRVAVTSVPAAETTRAASHETRSGATSATKDAPAACATGE